MGLNKSKTITTNRGIVFISNEASADAFDPKSINPADPTSFPSGWTVPGLTSKENKISFEREGGEVTAYHAWEIDAVDSDVEASVESFTLKLLEQNQEAFKFLHPDGVWDESLGAIGYNESGSVTRSVQVVFAGGKKRGGIYWNQVSLSEGDAIELGDGLAEQSLRGTILAPLSGKHRVVKFQVREYESAS